MNNGGTITVNLTLDNKSFLAAAAGSQAVGDQLDRNLNDKMAKGADRAATRFGAFAGVVKVGLLAAGAAAAVAATASVKMAGDFEQSLNILKSVAGATGAEMEKLAAKARELGKDAALPGVSAADAANAMTELAKAGVSVNNILGASKGVLSLAKAGQIEVAEAATIAARALNAFNLSGDKAGKVADVLAAGANASSADVDEMAYALSQASASASRMGLTLDDTVTALGLFSNAGVNGSDAGTSLKTMLARLVPVTKRASEKMKELGLNFFDSSGNFVGLRDAADQLQKKLSPLSQEQRELAINTIFGSDASRAAGIIAKNGAKGFDAMFKAVSRQGAATELAAAQNSGFKGALDNLKSTLETIAIDVGGKLLPAFTGLLKFMAANAVPIIIGITAAVVALGVAFATATIPAGAFAAVMAAIFSPVTAIILGVGALAAGIAVLQQKFGILTKIGNAIKAVFDLVVKGDFTKAFGQIFNVPEDSPIVDFILTLRKFVVDNVKQIIDSLASIGKQFAQAFAPIVDVIKQILANEAVQNVLKAIGIALLAIIAAPVVAFFGALLIALKVLATVLKFVADNFNTIKKVVLTALAVAFAPLIAIVFVAIKTFQFLVAAAKVVGSVFAAVFKAIGAVVSTVFNGIMLVWNTVLKPVFTAVMYILNALFTIWKTIWTGIFQVAFTILSTLAQIIFVIFQGVFTFIYNKFLLPVFNFFKSIFTAIFNTISSILGSIFKTISSIFTKIYNTVAPIVRTIFNVVTSIFRSIWNTVSGIVSGIFNAVSGAFNRVKNALIAPIKSAYEGIKNFAKNFVNAGKNIIDGIVKGVGNAKDAVVNKIKDICKGALDAVKNFFGIKSPSRVMATIGDQLMLGLTNGIDRTGSNAVSAMNGVSSSILGTVNNLTSGGLGTIGIDASGNAATGGGANIVQNNNIYNQVDLDAVTKELAWQVRR